MLRRARFLALSLGVLLATAVGACGSGDARESGATLAPPPPATRTTTPATTAATTTATTGTATQPPPATGTAPAPATTPTTTQPSGGAAPSTQSSGGAPGAAGCPSAVGGFIRDLRASDCGAGRTVATAWFDAVHGGAPPDGTIAAAGYSCSATLAGERASVSCSGDAGSVTFTASP